MKTIKILSIIILLTFGSWLIYCWFTYEEWITRKRCSDCIELENVKLHQLIGTIKLQADRKMVFTDTKTNITYRLILCDTNCDNSLNQWFERIGFSDFQTKEPYYFRIEGKQDTLKHEFLLDDVTLVSIQKAKGKLISIEGENKIQMAKFIIIDPFSSNLNANDTITLAYYNYKEPQANIDTALLTFLAYDRQPNIKNYYICPDYDGRKGILHYLSTLQK